MWIFRTFTKTASNSVEFLVILQNYWIINSYCNKYSTSRFLEVPLKFRMKVFVYWLSERWIGLLTLTKQGDFDLYYHFFGVCTLTLSLCFTVSKTFMIVNFVKLLRNSLLESIVSSASPSLEFVPNFLVWNATVFEFQHYSWHERHQGYQFL